MIAPRPSARVGKPFTPVVAIRPRDSFGGMRWERGAAGALLSVAAEGKGERVDESSARAELLDAQPTHGRVRVVARDQALGLDVDFGVDVIACD